MKKAFLVLPFAIILANCSSTRNTNSSSANTGTNTSGSTASSTSNTDATASGSVSASPSGASASGTTGVTGSNTSGMSASGSAGTGTTGSTNAGTGATVAYGSNSTSKTSSGGINWDVYDPNNYMMNPDKYLRPEQLGKTGGWTYNKDWRRNTNFTPEAVGQWQLVLTPEVAANWLPDTRRPETYASFWTPEAVMARYEATMAAQKKTSDSLIAVYAALNPEPVNGKGKNRSGVSTGTTASATGSDATTGATASGSATTGVSSDVAATTGSGTTGAVGTGGVSAATGTDSTTSGSNGIVPFALTAINGNKFMLPTLNMYIDNGSFTAYTGCNTAVGTIVVNGTSLKFEEATPNTNVECIGGFDQSAFIEKLKRADSYDVVNNQFRLKQGDQVLMVFGKNAL